jgi:hypothetical protein
MPRRFATFLILLALIAGIPGFSVVLESRQSEAGSRKTVWSGVYSRPQAARGRAEFAAHCAACHADDVIPANRSALFVGDAFMGRWREDDLDSLFTTIRTTMPRRAPGSLSADAYVDIVTYILQVNEFPAGDHELTADVLARVQIEGKGGPQPLPSFTVVQVAGCLAQGAGNIWMLTNATEPARTKETDKSTPEEMKAAAAKPPGSHRFRLQNFEYLGADFKPESHKGHKMQTKGTLMRLPGGDRIQLTSMEMIAADCAP